MLRSSMPYPEKAPLERLHMCIVMQTIRPYRLLAPFLQRLTLALLCQRHGLDSFCDLGYRQFGQDKHLPSAAVVGTRLGGLGDAAAGS